MKTNHFSRNKYTYIYSGSAVLIGLAVIIGEALLLTYLLGNNPIVSLIAFLLGLTPGALVFWAAYYGHDRDSRNRYDRDSRITYRDYKTEVYGWQQGWVDDK